MAMLRRTAALALAIMMMAAAFLCARAVSPSDYDMSAPENLHPDHLYAQSAILIDETSGEVLFSKNSRIRMYPASTTKIMTLLLALESGIDLDEKVTIPRQAADIPDGSSVIPVKPGDVTSFRDLLYGFMLSSGNDGANAIAALVSGNIDDFVARMNARAAELGCQGTHFVNAHGYHNQDHYSTAQDLAVISRAAMQNDMFRTIVAAPTWDMTVTRGDRTGTATITNRNSLLIADSKYYYPDCTGIKTGHHKRAGWCFVGSAERDGMKLICVVLNCEEEDQKWYDAARLFEYGFTQYERVGAQALLSRAQSSFDTVQIEDASEDDPQSGTLQLELGEVDDAGQTVALPVGNENALNLAAEAMAETVELEWTRELRAPVAQGERVGTLRARMPGGGWITAALTASRAVEKKPEATPVSAPTAPPSPDVTEAPAEEQLAAPRSGFGMMAVLIAALIALAALLAGLAAAQRRSAAKRAHRRGKARRRK